MWKWDAYPAVRLLAPLMAGILVSGYAGHIPGILLPSGIIFALTWLFFQGFFLSHRFQWLTGLVINTALILAGVKLASLQYGYDSPCHISRMDGDTTLVLVGRVMSSPEERPGGRCRFRLRLAWQVNDSSGINGEVLAYACTDNGQLPATGDLLALSGTVSKPQGAMNPGQFDYEKYLRNNGISRVMYCDGGAYRVLQKDSAFNIKRIAEKAREGALNLIRNSPMQEDEKSLLMALVLGDKTEIDPGLYREFASAGVIHILCVSGLHVGIIFLVVSLLLKPLDRLGRFGGVKWGLAAPAVWFYALVTGMSPSVLRASTMISLVIGGKLFSRHPVSINTIAASALILLVANPWNIARIGFQLSYLAVAGIILLQQPLMNIARTKYAALNKVIALTTLSVSAQLLTFPLSIHYFGRFPNLFILSNIVAVPLAGLLIHIALFYFLTAGIPWIGDLTGQLLGHCILLLRQAVGFIDSVPYSSSGNLYLSVPEVVIIYLIIGVLISMVIGYKLKKLLLIGILVSGFLLLNGILRQRAVTAMAFSVYNVPHHSAIDLQSGNDHYLICDSALVADTSALDYNLRDTWRTLRVGDPIMVTGSHSGPGISVERGLIVFSGKRIFRLGPDFRRGKVDRKIPVGLLVLSGNPSIGIEEVLAIFDFETLIFDSSNSRYRLEQWREECERLKVTYHSVPDRGAFVWSSGF